MYQQASGKSHSEHLIQLPDESVSLQDAPSAVFRLPPGDPFSEDKTVLWLGVQSLGFALVCDPHENLTLAESTLRLLVRSLLDHLKLLSSGSDILLKADRTEVILGKFLPHGQLLFLNDHETDPKRLPAGLSQKILLHQGKRENEKENEKEKKKRSFMNFHAPEGFRNGRPHLKFGLRP
ncbi:hypothetical protein JD844_026050 [Phrynosoma platyrhinos]|uniref:Adaptor related protein complex 5 subunit sigma 1 n=1 Tax=Phrynosoma platyrhinos TaxID=52577 RepID=A0ABQ7SEJ2_PHRPL|nr:hypothetical protein JD844_026050 [Phrynosoma platyrhinos]